MIARTALIVVVLLAAGAARGQTRFELAVGAQYGLQQEPAFVPGWVVAGGFEIDGQEFVVEAAWDRFVRTQEVYGRFDPFDEYPGMETLDHRYLTMAAGIRGGLDQEKRFSPFYQVLVGGFTSRFRTDYDWTGIDVEAENRNCGIWAGTGCCLRATTCGTRNTTSGAAMRSSCSPGWAWTCASPAGSRPVWQPTCSPSRTATGAWSPDLECRSESSPRSEGIS